MRIRRWPFPSRKVCWIYEIDEYTWHKSKDEQIRNHSGTGLGFFNEGTLEEVWSFRLSQLSAFAMLALFAFLLIAFTAFIIIKTPIRNYLPGYLDVEVRKEIMQNALRADSLERMIQIQSLYLNNVAGILSGTMPIDSIREIDSLARVNPDYEIPQTKEEKKFVKDFEEAEKYNLAVLDPNPVPSGFFSL